MQKKKMAGNEPEDILYPLFAVENYVVTPSIPQPIRIEREEQKEYIEKQLNKKNEVFVVTTKPNSSGKDEKLDSIGVVCALDKVMQMPGAPVLAFLRPLFRAKYINTVYSPEFPFAKVSPLQNILPPKRWTKEMKSMFDHVDKLFQSTMSYAGEPEKSAALKLVTEFSFNPVDHLYAISHVSPINAEEKFSILEADSFKDLLSSVILSLDAAEQRIHIQASIHEKTHQELSQQQKEAFLRVQLKNIREELGEMGDNDDISELSIKASTKIWTDEARKHFEKELSKLKRLNINNPEYSVQYSYLEAFLDLPWGNYNNKPFSIEKVQEILDRDHYGLEKVKERILEYMAVVKLRNDLKAPILCLYGPPGVGKTSIGKSVAEATGREYHRIALGGLHDEAEIRGHRRTYIGAMPGRFLHALSKCENGNPLILLDEIDKVGKDYKGDPSSALLEALDPEQNNTFHDNFIDFPYDLSKVLFIATANDLSTIPAPLKDRMEIIEMPGYTPEEKREIALRHLVDKMLEDNGFKKEEIKFSPEAIDIIVKKYTKEKGVRQLGKALGRIIRKLALLKVRGEKIPEEITPDLIDRFLDKRDMGTISIGFQ